MQSRVQWLRAGHRKGTAMRLVAVKKIDTKIVFSMFAYCLSNGILKD